jgi:hypothetical protein
MREQLAAIRGIVSGGSMDDKELAIHLQERHNMNPLDVALSDKFEQFRVTGLTVKHKEDHKQRQSELDHEH